MLPLVHFLPTSIQRPLIYRFTGWEKLARPTPEERAFYLEHFLNEINLLDTRSLAELFPEAQVITEQICGLSKSLIAFRPGHL